MHGPQARDDEPVASEVKGEVLPETESAPPGSPERVPRGWTQHDWDASLYGSLERRPRWASLSVGKGWLYAVVLAVVLLALLVAILATR